MNDSQGAGMPGTDEPGKNLLELLVAGADTGALHLALAELAAVPDRSLRTKPLSLVNAKKTPPSSGCQQTLTLSFFFDGTGNNLDADVPTAKHSNVARLFSSHLRDDKTTGVYRFYLPGIGTIFNDREVDDPGGTLWGSAFAAQGQARLNWAFARLKEKVEEAEKRATNPTNPIRWIKVAAFGFSRGAALARAFCRDLQKLCEESATSTTGWQMRKGQHPIEISFLGLFDTVASAGLPPSANNTLTRSRFLHWLLLKRGAEPDTLNDLLLKHLAFGSAGADPAAGPVNGHAVWAADMRIGAMVTRCVHMIAAHETRNSFSCDSTLFESSPGQFSYPSGTTEMLYPGVHSDVGGGYRPGEGGCRLEIGAQLSIIALRAMHAAALPSVPLHPLSSLDTENQRRDFALDPDSAKDFAHMSDLFMNYRQRAAASSVPGATRGLGGQINGHMRLYYAWRFHRIRRESSNRVSETKGRRERITAHEKQFANDKAVLDQKTRLATLNLSAAVAAEERLGNELDQARMDARRYGSPVDPSLILEHENTLRRIDAGRIEVDRMRSLGLASVDDSPLNAAIDKYDQILLAQAKKIVEWSRQDPSLKLRPHYSALTEAYRDEHERGKGLDTEGDAKLIEFFDHYVHDSLAGFDTDASWPSDPRIVYIGGDRKLRYAFQRSGGALASTLT